MTSTEEYDYVIVGAGSAGCVLANRLSEDGSKSVLLLEAGPEDSSLWMKIPAGTTKVFNPSAVNWGYFTEPEPHLEGRKIYWPRGKTLGGSSSINGMVYLRGHPEDYAQWERLGNPGWGWNDVMPFFKRSEDQEHGASELHGAGGGLAVTDLAIKDKAGQLFIEAAHNTGLPLRKDLNDGVQEGVGRAQVTVRNGRRSSTSAAFLHPVRNRRNLRVEVNALAEQVVFDGRRATGVRYTQGNVQKAARARLEVVLAGGVINSPQLLMLSGVGPAQHLQERGITVVADVPGVGENLQDHLYVYYNAKCKKEISLNHQLSGPNLYVQALRYFVNHSGYLNIGVVQATAFPRVTSEATRPNIEVSFRPMTWHIGERGTIALDTFPGLNAACSLLQPKARGRMRLASSSPHDYPLIYANYLSDPADLRVMREGLRWVRKTFATKPLSDFITEEQAPGAAVQSDADWEEFIREAAQSVYHPVGTCAMGNGPMAVVDHELRVRGVESLRVVDASVMPRITSANTNAATIMIGEKGADMIRSAAKNSS